MSSGDSTADPYCTMESFLIGSGHDLLCQGNRCSRKYHHMNSIPTISEYAFEQSNNDPRAIELLNTVFPGLFEPHLIRTLLDVSQGIQLVQGSTGFGEVVVHVSFDDLNTEIKGHFPTRKKTDIVE